ncbi:hypothetical protein ACNJYD_24640 [Bradyrhizobium sp. DASA03005]|nr:MULTISPECIES: hypothetical protein [Bradyrhizobium]MBR1168184.1 hypothetical protein [Bradyrhizobium liaoningense]UWU71753.1 hypothetical protein N2602_14805 [Bradyrhizobium sp. NC92]
MMKMKKMMLASHDRFESAAKNQSFRPAFVGQWFGAVRAHRPVRQREVT